MSSLARRIAHTPLLSLARAIVWGVLELLALQRAQRPPAAGRHADEQGFERGESQSGRASSERSLF